MIKETIAELVGTLIVIILFLLAILTTIHIINIFNLGITPHSLLLHLGIFVSYTIIVSFALWKLFRMIEVKLLRC